MAEAGLKSGRTVSMKRRNDSLVRTEVANQPLRPCVFTDIKKGVDRHTMRVRMAETPASSLV